MYLFVYVFIFNTCSCLGDYSFASAHPFKKFGVHKWQNQTYSFPNKLPSVYLSLRVQTKELIPRGGPCGCGTVGTMPSCGLITNFFCCCCVSLSACSICREPFGASRVPTLLLSQLLPYVIFMHNITTIQLHSKVVGGLGAICTRSSHLMSRHSLAAKQCHIKVVGGFCLLMLPANSKTLATQLQVTIKGHNID